MKVTRIIIGGIPHKLVKAKDLEIENACDLCSLSAFCLRLKDESESEEPRELCDIGGRSEADTFFMVDLDIDKTIKEVMDDEL